MDAHDDEHAEHVSGDVPEGVGPEVFRERLADATRQEAEHGAHMRLHDQDVYLEDIEAIEEDDEGHGRVTLRNGLIIGGITGAAIVAALATVRYRRRRRSG